MWRLGEAPTDHIWEAEQTPCPRAQGLVCARATSRHPEPRAAALWPLTTSEARAPLQTVYVAPRTLSFK